MATRVQYVVVDDLADHNFATLAAALRPYLAAARRLPKSTTRKADNRTADPKPSTIRRWWATNPDALALHAFQERGQIPHQVKAAFHAAHQS
ncbi:histone-like nucleoid-structuring protein Lsr2 [Actinoplanes sp. NPDC051475]|uniref:Lsr2 dimerization domain-containing protein n=1 Tax=Actinoplanes sp. NPDC051475 TaxID=3157225 RepID=UPI00344B3277